jgi:nickel/cobalt transporter (NicO) family protein
MFEFLFDVQRTIKSLLTADINTYAASENGLVLLAMLPFGILFGMAHALTPGHSKAVLASYVVGSGLKPLRATLVSMALSATHISSAILLATVTNTLITRTIVGAGRAPALEYVSRFSLTAIGLWLIYRALRQSPHLHGEGIAVGFIAGLVPCPLTLFVMVFAISKGVPEAGLAFSVSMFIGVSSVLVGVALIAAFAREHIIRLMQLRGQQIDLGVRSVELVSGSLLLTLSLWEVLN